jgi:hypothetical protein
MTDELTVGRVLDERDPDIQRQLINEYGVGRFRYDSHARPIDHDRFGTLWMIRPPSGPPLLMVEVVNSTPEPDGTRRRYNLRVPPRMRSALEAVAWTFGLTAREYRERLRRQT